MKFTLRFHFADLFRFIHDYYRRFQGLTKIQVITEFNPRIKTVKLFWLVNFSICLILIFVLLAPLYFRFVKTPTVISVEKDYFNWNISFPAITLCPMQKVDEDSLRSINDKYKESKGVDIYSYLWSISTCNLDTLEITDLQTKSIMPLVKTEDYARIAALTFKSFEENSVNTNTNWPISLQPVMTEMGMCHVINSNVAVFDDPFKWSDSNLEYRKTNIELTVYDADFFSQIVNYSRAYKVYIHHPDEVVHSASVDYSINEGLFQYIGVNVWSTRISEQLRVLPINTRQCRFLNEPIGKRYPVYTFNHCMLECRIQTILRLCGCIPHFYKPLPEEKICTLVELDCVIHYKEEIQTLSANPVRMRKSVKNGMRPSLACGCLSDCENDVFRKDSERFIRETPVPTLRVAITAYPKVRFVRQIIITFYDIILRSGGVINLCIGCSVISLMEFFLIFLRIPLNRLITKIRIMFLNLQQFQ